VTQQIRADLLVRPEPGRAIIAMRPTLEAAPPALPALPVIGERGRHPGRRRHAASLILLD